MGRLARMSLVLALVAPAPPQTVVLKITVTITAADGTVQPVPRHALLISDDPVTTSPHRYLTKADGTAEAFLRPGKYIVESDKPFVLKFSGPSGRSVRVRLLPGERRTVSVAVCGSGPTDVSYQSDQSKLLGLRMVSVQSSAPVFVPDEGACPVIVKPVRGPAV